MRKFAPKHIMYIDTYSRCHQAGDAILLNTNVYPLLIIDVNENNQGSFRLTLWTKKPMFNQSKFDFYFFKFKVFIWKLFKII